MSGTTRRACTGAPSTLRSGVSASSHGRGRQGERQHPDLALVRQLRDDPGLVGARAHLHRHLQPALSIGLARAEPGPGHLHRDAGVWLGVDRELGPARAGQPKDRDVGERRGVAAPEGEEDEGRRARLGRRRPDEAGQVLARRSGGESAHRDRGPEAWRRVAHGDLDPGARAEHQAGRLGLHHRSGPRGHGDGEAQERGEESRAHVASAPEATSVCSPLSVPRPRPEPRPAGAVGRRWGGRFHCPDPAPVCARRS